MSMRVSFFLVSFLVLFGFAKSDNSKEKEDCAQSLVGLSTCIPYVEGTAKAPTPDCCTGLKQMLKTNLKCLCVIIKDRNDPDLGLKINITLAFNLPKVCNTPANVSQCPALLNLPPNSPDAQVFYQIGNNSNTTSSQGSGGHENSESNPTSAPAINSSTSGTSAQQKVAGFCIKSRWLGLTLLWAFTSNFVDVK